jgi:type IX secretion system PorP/SprF family membrane protein
MKRFWFIILCFGLFLTGQAQQEIGFSQYFTALGYYNPAYAGVSGDMNVLIHSRLQWYGAINNAPASAFVTAEMPWNYGRIQQGIGVIAAYDKASSLYQRTHFAAQYAYKKKMGKGILSIGLMGGLISETFRGDSVRLNEDEGNDEIISHSTVDGKAIDLALGFFYSTDNYYIGISSTHLLAPTIKLDENMQMKVDRMYNLTAGYNILTRNPLFELRPSLFVQTNLLMAAGDVTARVVYKKMYNGGIGVRINDMAGVNAVILYLGADIKKLRLGYAYDFPTSVISKIGSHELMLAYRIELEKPKGNRNRHKSVRIL